MCHLLLSMPIVGLLAFVFLPLPQALAIYFPLATVSLGLFYLMFRSVKKTAMVGRDDLIGGLAEVISKMERGQHKQWLVRHKGELWTAESRDDLAVREQVKVISLEGIKLQVERVDSRQARLPDLGTKRMEERGNERHCN